MKKDIFILVGECATGKTTVEVELSKKFNRVVSYTTRPKRSNEIDGIDYYFVTDEEFDKLSKEGVFLEQTSYIVSGKTLRYALPKTGFLDDLPNIIVVNPHGVKEIFDAPEFKQRSVIFYFKSKLQTRIDRYVNRESSSEKYCNLVQRLKQDAIDFESFEDFLVKNNIDYLPVWNEGISLPIFLRHIEEMIGFFIKEDK